MACDYSYKGLAYVGTLSKYKLVPCVSYVQWDMSVLQQGAHQWGNSFWGFFGRGATQTLPTIQQRPALTWPRGDDAGPEFKLWRAGRTWCWCRRLGCPQCATCLQRWKLCKPSDNDRNEASIKTFCPSSSLIYHAKRKKKTSFLSLSSARRWSCSYIPSCNTGSDSAKWQPRWSNVTTGIWQSGLAVNRLRPSKSLMLQASRGLSLASLWFSSITGGLCSRAGTSSEQQSGQNVVSSIVYRYKYKNIFQTKDQTVVGLEMWFISTGFIQAARWEPAPVIWHHILRLAAMTYYFIIGCYNNCTMEAFG